jgi:hypothetical protein
MKAHYSSKRKVEEEKRKKLEISFNTRHFSGCQGTQAR